MFVDRDGTLNTEVGHLTNRSQLELLPGVAAAVRKLNNLQVPVVVVTNQSAVGRGMCTIDDIEDIHQALRDLLAEEQATITRFYYCPHHPSRGQGKYLVDCPCRKPKPGMLRQAAKDLDIDLARSVMVGDNSTDLQAGWDAGCRSVLVCTGHGLETQTGMADLSRQPDFIADGLAGAVDWILNGPQCKVGETSASPGRKA